MQVLSDWRLFTVIVVVVLCAAVLPTGAEAKKLNIMTATTDMAALTQEVGGDRVNVEAIAKGYQDPHFVEAKPSFLLKLRQADLLIVVGLQLEIGWLPPLITQSGNPRIQVGAAGYLDASQFARNSRDSARRGDAAHEGDVHPLGNPHYWLDPDNGRRIAEGIADQVGRDGSRRRRLLPAALPGLRQTPFSGRTEVGSGDAALPRPQSRYVSPFVSQLREAFWDGRHWLRGTAAGYSADSESYD